MIEEGTYTHTESIYNPKLDKYSEKISLQHNLTEPQELFSKSKFSKEVLDIINHELNK